MAFMENPKLVMSREVVRGAFIGGQLLQKNTPPLLY